MTDTAERERLANWCDECAIYRERFQFTETAPEGYNAARNYRAIAALFRAPPIPIVWRAINADDGRGLYGYWTDRGEWYCKSVLNAHEPINYGYTHFCPFPAAPQPKEPSHGD